MLEPKKYEEVSLLEFQNRFPSEKACWNHLVKMRWPQGIQCQHCNGQVLDFLESRKLFECRDCKKQTSATSGTMFHKTRTPLRKWFWAIFILDTSKKGVPMLYLQKQLDIKSYRTAWLIAHKIRTAMIQRDSLYAAPLEGVVQVDEIFIGGKQTKSDWFKRGPNKTPFLIAIQEDLEGRPKFVRFVQLEEVTEKHLIPAIIKTIKKGSLIKSDGANSYIQMPKLGYELRSVPFRKKELASQNLKWVNTLTSNLKRFLLSTHHSTHAKYQAAFLAEFAYRFNRRFWPKQAFDRLLYACLTATQVTLPELNA